MRIAIAARLAPVAVAISILIAGCSPTTEIVERQGQQYYRHNGLHFELLVPQGWTARSLSSDLAVELVAPREAGSSAAAVHVFSRRHNLAGSAEELADAVLQQMRNQLAVLPGEEVEEISLSDVTLAGRQARLMTRHVRQGPVRIVQEIYIIHDGSQIWSLIVSVPHGNEYAEDVAAIRGSFGVW